MNLISLFSQLAELHILLETSIKSLELRCFFDIYRGSPCLFSLPFPFQILTQAVGKTLFYSHAFGSIDSSRLITLGFLL